MTNLKAILLSGLLLGSLLPVQLCAAHLQPPAAAPAPVKLPDTPVAQTFGAYLEAFNSGDRAKLVAFLKARYPSQDADTQADQMLPIRERSGGFDIIRVEDFSTPLKIVARVKARSTGNEFNHVMEVAKEAPHGIALIGIADGGMDMRPWAAR